MKPISETFSRLATTLILALAAGQLSAQTRAPFMEDLPFRYEGQIGGLDAWSLEGHGDLWVVLPDGNTAVAGFVFNGRGADIGSVMLGLEPIDVQESLFGPAPEEAGDASENAAAPTTPPLAEAPSQDPRGVIDLQGDPDLQRTLSSALPAMGQFTETQRDAALADLVGAISLADSPQAFQIALLEWHGQVTGQSHEAEIAALRASPDIPAPGVSDDVPVEPSDVSGASISRPADLASVSTLIGEAMARNASNAPQEEPAPALEERDASVLLHDLAENTFWFGVGSAGAPPVYMIYDPACPYCARSIRNLEPRIEQGEIHLRIIPVPLTSRDSLALMAGILGSEDPAQALMIHGLQMAGFNRPGVEPQDPASMDPRLLEGIQANVNLLEDYQIPGVPFFAWQADTGPRFLAGVAARDYNFRVVR